MKFGGLYISKGFTHEYIQAITPTTNICDIVTAC
jgi:hypothetical protein